MNIRELGMVLIVGGCSSVGFSMGLAVRREVRLLQSLLRALSYMENQLRYTLTPLPELCRQTGEAASGPVGEVFRNLSRELEWQREPDVYSCTTEALNRSRRLTPAVHALFQDLGRSLGQFDLEGQLRQLRRIEEACTGALTQVSRDQDSRLRSYRTLGICAGAALAILLI